MGVEHGVVLPVTAREVGRRIRTADVEWRRSSRGRFVPAVVARTPAQRVAEAGVLLRGLAAVTGWGSLAWHGSRWASGLGRDGLSQLPVPVAQPRRVIRPQQLLHLCEERFDPTEVVVHDGLRVTSPVRSTCFAMRYAASLGEAVRLLDMAASDDLVSIDEVATWAAGHPSYTGIDQCRRAVVLGDENAWSPMEVDMRLDWSATVRRWPSTNRPVFDLHGRHLGTPDLIDPIFGVVGQYHGLAHLDGVRWRRDIAQEGVFRDHGLSVVVMTGDDRQDPRAYHQRLRSAYRSASLTPVTDRAWTTELPHWWVPTWTVEQRRALDDRDREIWLAYRAA